MSVVVHFPVISDAANSGVALNTTSKAANRTNQTFSFRHWHPSPLEFRCRSYSSGEVFVELGHYFSSLESRCVPITAGIQRDRLGGLETSICRVCSGRPANERNLTRDSSHDKKNVAALLCLLMVGFVPAFAQQPKYPFNDPNLPEDKRIDNLLSLMTTQEKIDVLGTRTGVPRLGVPNIGSSEGIHGVVQREPRFGHQPITTTQFPQPPGMGDSWDPELVRQAGGVEGFEARYITETPKYDRQILMDWGSAVGPGPRSALGTQRRGVWRGSVLQRDDGGRVREGYRGRRSEVLAGVAAAEAFPGERERGSPQQLVVGLRRAAVLGVLLGSLPHGVSAGRRERGDGLVQRMERHADGGESDPEKHCARPVGRGCALDRRRRGDAAGESAASVSEPGSGGGGVHQKRD